MLGLIIPLGILLILVAILIMVLTSEKHQKTAQSPNSKMTGYWNGIERRACVRIKTSLKTNYRVDEKSATKKNSVTENISLGGMLMQLYEKLYPPTRLLLDIFLPNDPAPILAKGEVVWIKERPQLDESGRRTFDAGIKFIFMNSRHKVKFDEQLKDVINQKNG